MVFPHMDDADAFECQASEVNDKGIRIRPGSAVGSCVGVVDSATWSSIPSPTSAISSPPSTVGGKLGAIDSPFEVNGFRVAPGTAVSSTACLSESSATPCSSALFTKDSVAEMSVATGEGVAFWAVCSGLHVNMMSPRASPRYSRHSFPDKTQAATGILEDVPQSVCSSTSLQRVNEEESQEDTPEESLFRSTNDTAGVTCSEFSTTFNTAFANTSASTALPLSATNSQYVENTNCGKWVQLDSILDTREEQFEAMQIMRGRASRPGTGSKTQRSLDAGSYIAVASSAAESDLYHGLAHRLAGGAAKASPRRLGTVPSSQGSDHICVASTAAESDLVHGLAHKLAIGAANASPRRLGAGTSAQEAGSQPLELVC